MATRETPRGVEGLEATGFADPEKKLIDESAKGQKLVWKNGAEFHGEFGRFGGDALGHSYQYGCRICDYYLESLGLEPPPAVPKK